MIIEFALRHCSCTCLEGYELAEDGVSCIDMNECDDNTCSHSCHNTAGALNCCKVTHYYYGIIKV